MVLSHPGKAKALELQWNQGGLLFNQSRVECVHLGSGHAQVMQLCCENIV